MRARQLATLFACLTPLVTGAQTTPPASTQAPAPVGANLTGFFVGFDPATYAVLRSDVITEGRRVGGTGVSLRFGWGFTERWAVLIDVPVTDLVVSDSADFLLSHGDFAVLFVPATARLWGRALVPFVQAGLGFRALESTLYGGTTPLIYDLEGEVFSIGAGARIHVEPAWAIVVQAWWSSGDFNDERIGNTTTHNRAIAATSYRVQAGLEWHRYRAPRCRC